jgi:dCTP diphosphatase
MAESLGGDDDGREAGGAAPAALTALQARLRAFAQARDWEQFHNPKNLAMALVAEAGELVEQFQWLSAAQSSALSAAQREAVRLELADVFIYLLRLADVLGIDLTAAAQDKIAINETRYPVELTRGSARKYDEY